MSHHLTPLNILLVRLALGAAISGILVWSYVSTKNRLRNTFAQKWGLDLASANRLYARRHGVVATILMWLAFGPVFFFATTGLVMVFGANINDVKNMMVSEMYWIPFVLIMMGLYFILIPARDLAYGFRLRDMKPEDFPHPQTEADLAKALATPPPRFYGFRLLGLISLGLGLALVWGEVNYHADQWLDKVSVHHNNYGTH